MGKTSHGFFAQIFPCRPAIDILADNGFDRTQAFEMIKTLAANGYFVAPVEPSNAMLHACLTVYQTPTNLTSILSAVGKARDRWKAMGAVGTRLALSRNATRHRSPVEEHVDVLNEGEESKQP